MFPHGNLVSRASNLGMRLFQSLGISPTYRPRLERLRNGLSSFAAARDALLADRYGACHILQPVLEANPEAFFAIGNDVASQRRWAREQGLSAKASLLSILRAQIEHHRTEVFYNLDPMLDEPGFIRQLPGCVKHTVAWRAAPSGNANFSDYQLMVCNFPGILQGYASQGIRSAYFAPAHDPVMDRFARNADRPIDLLFVGGYSRHHQRRAAILETVAALNQRLNIVFHLDRSRLTRLAESPLGRLPLLKRHRRPSTICTVSAEPVFGIDLYAAISRAKVILNGAVDMAGIDRGNMRCFEAMGCGALMVSDAGNYPVGMVDGQTMLTYESPREAADRILDIVANTDLRQDIAQRGWQLVRLEYDKARQWQNFQQLVAAL